MATEAGGAGMKIAVVANSSWYIYNFRRNLMLALRESGHECVAVAGNDAYTAKLRQEGFACRGARFTGAGTNPVLELLTVRDLRKILVDEQIDLALTFTPKGTIYTALAATGISVRIVANISGIGRAFSTESTLSRLVARLYRIALRRVERVFFQNDDDQERFVRKGLVDRTRVFRLPGSGVDLHHFTPRPSPDSVAAESTTRFLMVARMIRDKGVFEYAEAARIARDHDPNLQFDLLGPLDSSRSDSVSLDTLAGWSREGVVNYRGSSDDVRDHLAAADCVILPSYYPEGVPRSLLEAAAMGRPIITTDATGCRDCVDDGISGYLCRPRSAEDLTRAIFRFTALTRSERQQMGISGRAKVEREFDERTVIGRYIEAVEHPP
jgi:glycosyltransferase involved in cell wall biosynthesis